MTADRRQQTLELIARASRVSVSALEPEMNLLVDLGLDSPEALRLLMDLEELLGIEISDAEADRIKTVGDILDYVASLP
jgi:acyl carrier protein